MMPLEHFEQWYALALCAAGTAALGIAYATRNRKKKP